MKKLILTLTLFTLVLPALPWGKTGHRVIGLIAERHLTKKARKNIESVLGSETLAEVSNYMDFIRSDHAYDHMSPWHYCTIPVGKTYPEAGTPEGGDAIVTIERLMEELKSKQFTDGDEAFALKCLVHLIGDIHQPLHVGNGLDRGGNDVKVDFFWNSSNLHRVWDSDIIDHMGYSYTEYADWIDHTIDEEIAKWQSAKVLDWAYESQAYLLQVYKFPEDNKLGYDYVFQNRQLVNQRLLQAGIRLAGILNQIYG